MPIYTKFGDAGETSLLSGRKISKADARIDACGSVDELSAFIGLIIAFSDNNDIKETLANVQKHLFVIGADLSNASGPSRIPKISPMDISELETRIDAIDAELPKLTHFILPGGSKTAALIHLARTVCRRAERTVVILSQKEKIDPNIIIYLNRLGDFLFMLAREVNRKKKIEETIWRGYKTRLK
jgi:cob(I)alamin adenosyltransferase